MDLPEEGKIKLCIYYLNQCGYCDRIMRNIDKEEMTIFQKLNMIYSDNPNIEILAFEANTDPEVKNNKYGITGFPTILLIKFDQTVEYNIKREITVDDISKFIIQHGYGG
jgi:thioredoxin-related protein